MLGTIPNAGKTDPSLLLGELLAGPVAAWLETRSCTYPAGTPEIEGVTLLSRKIAHGRTVRLTWHDGPLWEPPAPFLRVTVYGPRRDDRWFIGVYDGLDAALAGLAEWLP